MASIDPRPFTAEDFARRMQRAAEQAEAAGLTGVLVTPGPDLVYLAGYAPVAITERLTVLIVQKRPRAGDGPPRPGATRRRGGPERGDDRVDRLD